MINIYADHGEHGNFLSMSLNVLEGNFDLKNNKSGVTFDFWTGRLPHYRDAKNPNKAGPMPSEKNVLRWGIDVDYKYNHKMPGTEDIISEESFVGSSIVVLSIVQRHGNLSQCPVLNIDGGLG